MNNRQMRDEFEEWWAPYGYEMMTDGETYYGRETHFAWMAWKSSRESLVIQLPNTKTIDVCDAYNRGVRAYRDAVKRSIERMGVGVKL